MEHSFDIDDAKKFGILEAVIIRHLQYWILKNKSNGSNFHNGRTWTYNSIKGFSILFDYVSERQVRYAVDHLVKSKVIMKGNFNSKGYDKTSWYAFVDETHCQNRQIHLTKLSNPFDKIVKPIPDRSTDRSTDTGALPFPGEKFATAWKQWVEHRAEIKKKLTPASIKKQFDFLKSYDVTSAIAIINKSIQNGWRGLFAPDKKELTSGETPNQKMRKFKF